jgi:predicted lysophospholipase L1 biosynthesis ABC-type transport system permease subunit
LAVEVVVTVRLLVTMVVLVAAVDIPLDQRDLELQVKEIMAAQLHLVRHLAVVAVEVLVLQVQDIMVVQAQYLLYQDHQ